MARNSKQNKVNNQNGKKTKTYFIKKRRKPLEIVFDEKAREDFLTGFRKRKLQRKKKAQEDLEAELKAERKRIRHEAKNALSKLVSRPDDPQFEEIMAESEVVDMGSHEVHVTELDPDQLAKDNNWIGSNVGKYVRRPESDEDGNSDPESKARSFEIEGMEAKRKKIKSEKDPELKTKKDIKNFVKKIATKNVQSSKVYQKKRNIERIKNKRKKAREERAQEKSVKKHRRRRRNNMRNVNTD